MRVSSFFAVAVASALVLGPRAALADDDELKPAAKARRDAGAELTKNGKYDEAIREFRAAYEIDPAPVLFYSLAVAERLAGRCPAAIDHYRRFLASKPNAERTEAARAGIAMCQPRPVAARCPPPPSPPRPWYRNPVGVAIGAGVVGAGIGTGYLIASSSTSGGASSAAFSDDFEAQLDRATGQRRIGGTFLAVGLALAGGGVAYHYLVQRKRPGARATAFGIAGRSIFLARSF
jgi:tetratricopeptide (TPR) repeat protein